MWSNGPEPRKLRACSRAAQQKQHPFKAAVLSSCARLESASAGPTDGADGHVGAKVIEPRTLPHEAVRGQAKRQSGPARWALRSQMIPHVPGLAGRRCLGGARISATPGDRPYRHVTSEPARRTADHHTDVQRASIGRSKCDHFPRAILLPDLSRALRSFRQDPRVASPSVPRGLSSATPVLRLCCASIAR